MAIHLLAHDQVGAIDVIHLVTDAPKSILQPQLRLPQFTLCHPIHHVNGLALGLWHYFGVTINVGDLFEFDFQS